MKRTTLYVAIAALALVALAVASFAVAGDGGKKRVKADALSGYNEVPAISSTGRARFSAQVDTAGQTITYTLTYSGLSGNPLFAHIHFGQRDVSGAVVAFLCGGGGKPACPASTSGTVTGTIVPADVGNFGSVAQGIGPGEFAEFVAAIRAGRTYVNIHTPTYQTGEIRAQLNDRNQKDD